MQVEVYLFVLKIFLRVVHEKNRTIQHDDLYGNIKTRFFKEGSTGVDLCIRHIRFIYLSVSYWN